jgi:hypothetical protein
LNTNQHGLNSTFFARGKDGGILFTVLQATAKLSDLKKNYFG